MSSKYFDYARAYPLGNPGNYRTLYLGYHANGADFTPGGVIVSSEGTAEDHDSALRNHPNTFGMGGGLTRDRHAEFVEYFGLGVDYFSTRNLPDNLVQVSFDPEAFW